MTRRQVAITVAALLLLGLAGVLIWRSPSEEASPDAATGDSPMVEADGDQALLRLYFPGGGGWLIAEERAVPVEGAGADLTAIATEVLAGPTSAGLRAPFPANTELGSVFISESGIAYVDLISTRANPPPSGSRDEMLSVYSLVNSVLANLPDLSAVVLLWNGQQRPTFAGHLDTGRPLEQNRSLVAKP